ncbi:MAG: maltokinase N-terminal cap-like domain-containing protein [Streptosporangiaceae bacterium]
MSKGAMTFEQMLARWLPAQRWYGGHHDPAGQLAILSDTMLVRGEPALRHLIIGVPSGQEQARYQVLVGLRADMPATLRHAVIGPAGDGLTAYDALHDPQLCGQLPDGIAAGRKAGPLRFVREPGTAVGSWPGSRVMSAEQSNTSVVFGEDAILKVLRRVFPGVNPDLEVADALARLGSRRIAPPFGWIQTELDGEVVLLAVLSKYLAGASDGWTLATANLRKLYAQHGNYERDYLTEPLAGQSEAGTGAGGEPDFAAEALALGRATAEMHADLATAFGTSPLPAAALAGLSENMIGKLDQAVAEVPELAVHAAKLRAAYAEVVTTRRPALVQRVHGDYHLGQVLRTQAGWVALDFEGEPAVPLEVRRAPAPALRDVAGLLRSFDYAARHRLLGHPDAERLRGPADAWVARCRAAFCAGYAQAGGMDPKADAVMLRALMLEKAVYEVIYEAHHRPAWMSIPLDSIAAA